jgi:hypothetical protein
MMFLFIAVQHLVVLYHLKTLQLILSWLVPPLGLLALLQLRLLLLLLFS